MFTRLTTCKWWYKPWVTIARGDICYRGTNMWKIVFFTAITLQLLECTLGAVCSQREKSRAGQQWAYSELCFPWSVGINILIKMLFSQWRSRQRKSRNGTSAVKTLVLTEICFPCFMGSIILSSEKDDRWRKSLTPLHFRAFQVRELTIPKSRGENVLFQGFIFCYWSAVKRIIPKWAKNDQEHKLKSVQKPLGV